MQSWVYILKCADGSYYVGKTDASVEQRVAQHNGGFGSAFTKSRRPVSLVWAEGFLDTMMLVLSNDRSKVGDAKRRKP